MNFTNRYRINLIWKKINTVFWNFSNPVPYWKSGSVFSIHQSNNFDFLVRVWTVNFIKIKINLVKSKRLKY